jgi:hypothetical protein
MSIGLRPEFIAAFGGRRVVCDTQEQIERFAALDIAAAAAIQIINAAAQKNVCVIAEVQYIREKTLGTNLPRAVAANPRPESCREHPFLGEVGHRRFGPRVIWWRLTFLTSRDGATNDEVAHATARVHHLPGRRSCRTDGILAARR